MDVSSNKSQTNQKATEQKQKDHKARALKIIIDQIKMCPWGRNKKADTMHHRDSKPDLCSAISQWKYWLHKQTLIEFYWKYQLVQTAPVVYPPMTSQKGSSKFGLYGAASGVTCGAMAGQLYQKAKDAITCACFTGLQFFEKWQLPNVHTWHFCTILGHAWCSQLARKENGAEHEPFSSYSIRPFTVKQNCKHHVANRNRLWSIYKPGWYCR